MRYDTDRKGQEWSPVKWGDQGTDPTRLPVYEGSINTFLRKVSGARLWQGFDMLWNVDFISWAVEKHDEQRFVVIKLDMIEAEPF